MIIIVFQKERSMRQLLLLTATVVWGTAAVARVFRDPPVSYARQFYVPAASYPGRRYNRSPEARLARSRVFRNVVVSDEPRLRAQGRFYKRAQAVPIHDPTNLPSKNDVTITSYSYDEDKHHEKKLVEDTMTMVEANEFARGLERTTVSVKNEEPSTTSVPSTTSQARAQTKSDFQPSSQPFTSPQPAQPAPAFKSSPGSRTFSQTVQAGTPPNFSGRPPVFINPTQPPFSVPPQPFPNGFLPAIPGTPALPLVPPLGTAPQGPILPPNAGPPNIPNFSPPPLPQPHPGQLPPPPLPGGPAGAGGPNLPPNGTPPNVRDVRFEVINQQSANSSLEQLGCGFDWLTNTCKDVFNIGWCGRCHDFGNIFLHDCKCIQPLVQLPPRQPQHPPPPPPPPPHQRPALMRYIY